MGTGRVPLKVNSKGKKNLECMEEMHAFMQCFAVSTGAETHLPTVCASDCILTLVSVAVGHRWRCKVCRLEDSTR